MTLHLWLCPNFPNPAPLTVDRFHQLLLTDSCGQLFYAHVCFQLKRGAIAERVRPLWHVYFTLITFNFSRNDDQTLFTSLLLSFRALGD